MIEAVAVAVAPPDSRRRTVMSGRCSSPTASELAKRTTAPTGERSARSDESAPPLRTREDLSRTPEPDIVDEAGQDSFPSSDPPSWSRAVAL